ncbi:MAG: AAA family ATPase [Xanthobacteraceae bacterium]
MVLETPTASSPIVIALMGLPGSGKTTVATLLARTCALSVISRDVIREALFRPCGFTEVERQTAYRALLIATGACLTLGRSCVIDGMTFSRAAEVNDMRAVARRAGARFLPVLLDCPTAIAQARASAESADHRRAPANGDAAALIAAVARRFELPPADTLHLDATKPPEAIASAIRDRIDAFPDEDIGC